MSEAIETPPAAGDVIGCTAIFASSNIQATLNYYKQVLGFDSSWTWGEPPTFGSASWGSATIMFHLNPELAAHIRGHQHWIRVLDVDGLYDQHRTRGANIVSELENKPWGVREYTVEDPDGYHLRFVGDAASQASPSTAFPEGVQIVRRNSTPEEHAKLAGAEFYNDRMVDGVLERTWGGVLALAADGEAIGMVRIMCDAPGWFSIWDVVVKQDWRGRRIGEKMMKEALDMIREASPGAWVYLFTYKHGFYEKLGFDKQSVQMRKA